MSKQIRGSKRLKLIQNYLKGIEDEEFEVMPSKIEGKYFVRKRKEPLKSSQQKEEPIIEESSKEEPIEEPKPIATPKPIPPPIPKPSTQAYDPTMSIEILNQLKLLGEEMKKEREKKEQKRMIKEVMQKQMNKPRYIYTQPQYIQEPNEIDDDDEPIEDEPQQVPQPIYRKRNNIFADMF